MGIQAFSPTEHGPSNQFKPRYRGFVNAQRWVVAAGKVVEMNDIASIRMDWLQIIITYGYLHHILWSFWWFGSFEQWQLMVDTASTEVGKLLYDALKSESSVTEILKEPYYNTSQATRGCEGTVLVGIGNCGWMRTMEMTTMNKYDQLGDMTLFKTTPSAVGLGLSFGQSWGLVLHISR